MKKDDYEAKYEDYYLGNGKQNPTLVLINTRTPSGL